MATMSHKQQMRRSPPFYIRLLYKLISHHSYFTASGSAPAQSTSAKSKQKLETLFDSLRDGDDDADTVTIDGTMKYFQDIGVNFEDASLFVALEAVKATTMGELEKTPFVNGWLEKGYISQPSTPISSIA